MISSGDTLSQAACPQLCIILRYWRVGGEEGWQLEQISYLATVQHPSYPAQEEHCLYSSYHYIQLWLLVQLSVSYSQVVQSMLMPAVDFRDTESSEFQVFTCIDPSSGHHVHDQPLKESILQYFCRFHRQTCFRKIKTAKKLTKMEIDDVIMCVC